ncbi:hypothetical protein SDC9_188420 [bioreactor metagenome]|uniref:Uncharacterized protein n=1 Tax=bioreactor metagenome TaxID=1076179 RepID=A0A645HPV6_9ZZZZ
MTYPDLMKLVAWICMVVWGVWYVNVQLERLNTDVFEQLRNSVLMRLKKSSGVLRIVGIVLYSPYLMPLQAAIVWFVTAIFLFVL